MNNLAQKCLEHLNAAVGVDEGKNATSANQHSSSTNDRSYINGNLKIGVVPDQSC